MDSLKVCHVNWLIQRGTTKLHDRTTCGSIGWWGVGVEHRFFQLESGVKFLLGLRSSFMQNT